MCAGLCLPHRWQIKTYSNLGVCMCAFECGLKQAHTHMHHTIICHSVYIAGQHFSHTHTHTKATLIIIIRSTNLSNWETMSHSLCSCSCKSRPASKTSWNTNRSSAHQSKGTGWQRLTAAKSIVCYTLQNKMRTPYNSTLLFSYISADSDLHWALNTNGLLFQYYAFSLVTF